MHNDFEIIMFEPLDIKAKSNTERSIPEWSKIHPIIKKAIIILTLLYVTSFVILGLYYTFELSNFSILPIELSYLKTIGQYLLITTICIHIVLGILTYFNYL